jgi:hypothetical protein
MLGRKFHRQIPSGTQILVNTSSPKTALKRWFGLGLLVLLAHLGLLQSMPLGLSPARSQPDPTLRFATRTLLPAAESAPLLTKVVAATPKKPTTAPKPAPTPEARDTPAPVAAEDVASALSFAPVAPSLVAASANDVANGEQLAASSASAAASVPEHAQPLTPPLPEPQPLRHPRARPPSFNVARLTGSVRLHYKVSANKFPYTLNGELLWNNQGDHYDARLSYSAFGLSRSQSSLGQIASTGLAPQRFADKYRSEVAAHFNYAEGRVTFSANTPDAALLAGAQDRLSVLLQLGALVASEPERYDTGTTLTLQTVGARDADLWLFTMEGTETLALPGGTLQGLKLVRVPRKPYDQKVEVWLAAQLGYLPARIRVTETNGDTIDQQWQSSAPITTLP